MTKIPAMEVSTTETAKKVEFETCSVGADGVEDMLTPVGKYRGKQDMKAWYGV